MIKEKHKGIITIIAFSLAVLLCIGGLFYRGKVTTTEKTGNSEYADKLFNDEFISIDIIADESTWNSMLENAENEQYSKVDIIINGEKFSNVGIRPKGNSTLSQIAKDDSTDRFSFKIKFDEYIDGQTCFGLDTLILNNMVSDNTYMKEYIAFDIMNYIGVDSALYNYCSISVNGKAFGFYLALEGYNDSFESRMYNDTSGNLYSAKSNEMGGNGQKDQKQFSKKDDMADNKGMPDNAGVQLNGDMPENGGMQPNLDDTGDNTDGKNNESTVNTANTANGDNNFQQNMKAQGMNGQGQMRGMGGNSGTNLKYTDDDVSSYSGILDNAVGSKTSTKDKKRVIEAIKNLNNGTNLEDYFDVDQVLRYLAAHTVVVNMDSYSASMCQNYFLYENDGKVTILPWDYGLSFGGMMSGNSSSVINFPIDTPVSSVEMEDRPLISKLLEVPEYKERYHKYLKQIYEGYLSKNKITKKINKLSNMINKCVKEDASALCTYEEYKTAVSTLQKTLILRGESIEGQLNGDIPSTTDEQSKDSSALIKDDSINISVMGGMGGMKGMGNHGGNQDTKAVDNTKAENDAPSNDNMQNMQNMQNKNQNPPNMNTNNTINSSMFIIPICIGSLIVGIIIVCKYKRKKYRA